MPIAAALGETLVGLDQLDELSDTSAESIRKYVENGDRDSGLSVPIGRDVSIGPHDLDKARNAKSTKTPYQGIGIGKSLTIVIESIYLGNYPDAMPWNPFVNDGDVLLTSAHKTFQTFAAAPRAVHLLEKDAKRGTFLEAKATSPGSQLVYYTPAVTDLELLFAVELSVDRDFNTELGDALAKAMTAASALPVFAPAAPYLVAAGIAIPIAEKAANMLARPHTFFAESPQLNFGLPGVELAQPGALVLRPGGDDPAFYRQYKLGSDFKLRNRDTDEPYDGPLPYVVISLDGNEHSELEDWSATAASAALMERFFATDGVVDQALQIATESMTLYNDMEYRNKAAEALKKSKGLPEGAEKKQQQDLYEAYLKNIQNKELQKTVK